MTETKTPYLFTSVKKIISGGQTGVDRAGLDVAIHLGLEYGGAIPKGRLTEDGTLDPKYDKITELSTSSYPARTEKNILDSDATLIFTRGEIGRGTALTIRLAKKYKKPFLHIDLNDKSEDEARQIIGYWLRKIIPKTLNIAGTRESKAKGISRAVYSILLDTLSSNAR